MIFITGDTHGRVDYGKLSVINFPAQEDLTRNDHVIICGDWGGVWDNKEQDRDLQNWYSDKNFITLFVDGNHENHDILDSYPVSIWNGGKVHFIRENIIHLMRGQVYEIDGMTFFTMGGAVSQDKMYRKEGKDWWAREMPSNAEYEEGFANLEHYCNKVDIILSHCAPDVIQTLLADWYIHDKLTNYLEVVRSTVQFRHWFFGHYHVDRSYGNKYFAVYDKIFHVWENGIIKI